MHCFQITERVQPGLAVVRHGYPHIPTPPTCPQLLLDKEIAEFILDLPDGEMRYGIKTFPRREPENMDVELGKDHVLFRRNTRRRDRLALVRVETAAGDGGKVFLNANAYDVEMRNHTVRRNYRAFPDAGVVPLCSDDELARANTGAVFLDMLVLMYEGASFRVYRNGRLEGASPQMFVHWNGRELRMTCPRRYDERAGEPLGATAG